MESLGDCQVKIVTARHEHYVGNQRRMVNQMRTGTEYRGKSKMQASRSW
jgi:hypothetical protein